MTRESAVRAAPSVWRRRLDSLRFVRTFRVWLVPATATAGPKSDSNANSSSDPPSPMPRPSVTSATISPSARASSAWQRLLWIAIVLVHWMCAIHYSICAFVYNALPSTVLLINMRAFGVSIDPKHFPAIAVVHALCATLHACLLLEMLLYSLWFRRLLFTHEMPLREVQQQQQARRKQSLQPLARAVSRSATVRKWIGRAQIQWHRWFGPTGVFGVDQSYFPALFLTREIVEITLQSYQAYKMSCLVPRRWLNELYVTLLVFNCWTTPVVTELVYRQHHRRALRLCIFVDTMLDFVSTVSVPSILAFPYWQSYDVHTHDFRDECWFSDAWYVNMVNELRMLFIQSWTDCTCQFAFCVSLLLCLDDLKILASSDANGSDYSAAAVDATATVATNAVAPAPAPAPAPTLAVASATEHRSVAATTTIQQKPNDRRRLQQWETRLRKCGHVVMVVWGIAVAVVHLEAQRDTEIANCLVHVHPWLSPKAACMLMLVDCVGTGTNDVQQQLLQGTAAEIERAWDGINEDMLELLTIANCPALHIPPSIDVFANLMGLNLLNVTVVEWTDAAALTQARHPNMRHIGLMFADFTPSLATASSVFSPGLLARDHAPLLRDVFILECNLGGLPDRLHTSWPALANMMLPANAIEMFPSELLRMQPMRIVLDGNRIATIPLDVFAIDSLVSLELSDNPMDALPPSTQSFVVGKSLLHVVIKRTNVSTLPAWMTTSAFLTRVSVRAGGTPLCARLLGGATIDAQSQRLAKYIDCRE